MDLEKQLAIAHAVPGRLGVMAGTRLMGANTHTQIYNMYIYIYVYLYVCMYVCM